MAIKAPQIKRILKTISYPSLIVVIFAGLLIKNDNHPRVIQSELVRVIDGDTVVLEGSIKIRLQGIDAPEIKQVCYSTLEGKETPILCGKIAKEMLIKIINSKKLNCTDEGKDKYKRQLSYCYVGDINVNNEMVRQGYAVAYTVYDLSFMASEWIAHAEKKGIWQWQFERPEKWRKNKK